MSFFTNFVALFMIIVHFKNYILLKQGKASKTSPRNRYDNS